MPCRHLRGSIVFSLTPIQGLRAWASLFRRWPGWTLATQAFSFSLQVAEWYQSDIKTLTSWKRQVIMEKQLLVTVSGFEFQVSKTTAKERGEREASAGVS